jgi:hypothetical protein
VLPGVAFRETMSGSYWRLDAPTQVRTLSLSLEARAPDLALLLRERAFRLRGIIDAEALATGRPVEGSLAFRFVQQGRLHYRVAFTGDDGDRYELGGQKEWSPLAPVESLSILAASLYGATGAEFAHVSLRFAARSGIWAVVKSVRLASLG